MNVQIKIESSEKNCEELRMPSPILGVNEHWGDGICVAIGSCSRWLSTAFLPDSDRNHSYENGHSDHGRW